MAIKVRVLLSSVLFVTAMWLVSCGHYTCGVTFGSSTCTPASGGVSQGGTGGSSSTAAAFLYVAVGGGVDGIAYNPTAKTFLEIANFVSPTTANSSAFNMVVAQKTYLYTSTPATGQIYGWSIGSNGFLTAITGSPFTAPYLVGSVPSGTGGMIVNLAGTLLFVASPTGNLIYAYQIGSGGALSLVNPSGFSIPFVPGNLGMDGLGKYLYVGNIVTGSSSNQVAAFSIGSTGSLTAVSGSPFSYPMSLMQGDASGNYLIGVTQISGDNHLYVFNIQQSGANAGAISPVSGSPFATVYAPFRIAAQPSTGGNLVYSFSVNNTTFTSNPTEGYQLNATTGQLTVVAGSPFTAATGDWGQFDESGSLLFVFDSYKTVMYGENVGSNGALTETLSVGFFDDPWAVTDSQ
jgi:6-phosphogluconolactonase